MSVNLYEPVRAGEDLLSVCLYGEIDVKQNIFRYTLAWLDFKFAVDKILLDFRLTFRLPYQTLSTARSSIFRSKQDF